MNQRDHRGEQSASIPTSLTRVAWWLAGGGVVLASLAGLFFVGMVLTTPGEKVHSLFFQLWYLFDVGAERNIPSWYASMLWAAFAGSAFAAAVLACRKRVSWAAMGLVGVAASIDEHSELHERLDQIGTPLAEALGWDLWFTWVIPGVVIAVVVAALLLPLVLSLRPRSRWLVLAGGAVFLLGAIVVESLSGLVLAHFADQVTWHFILVTLVEELLEMLGLALAIAGVLAMFDVSRLPERAWTVRFRDSTGPAEVAGE